MPRITIGFDYLTERMARGHYAFTTEELRVAFKNTPEAARAVVRRLKQRRAIATPYRGFHLILPPELQRTGSPPAETFIDELMRHLKVPYYVGLLSAAHFHGATKRPELLQVITNKNRPRILCGPEAVFFVARANMKGFPTRSFDTGKGTVLVSTPEATALDLITYPEHAGGLKNVASILSSLAKLMSPRQVLNVAKHSGPIAYIQRLGFILEELGEIKLSDPLHRLVRKEALIATPLTPGKPHRNPVTSDRWKVVVNAPWE